jgi:fructose 1,6-bisphosphatase
VSAVSTNVGDLVTLSGVAQNDEDLGTFTGSTITDSVTVKAALQLLEAAVEDISAIDSDVVDAGDNVNRLTASTSADAEPATWKFLAVDCSDGSIKVIDKTFVEVD